MTAQAGGAALLLHCRDGRSRQLTCARSCGRDAAPCRCTSASSASRQFARILRRSHLLRPGRRIAVYVAHDSEADPLHDRATGATQRAASCTFPRSSTIAAAAWSSGATRAMRRCARIATASRNRERAPRRASQSGISTWFCVPLVAVDARGTRLGSGAGFYDRAPAAPARRTPLAPAEADRRSPTSSSASSSSRPRAWDVPLDALLTEKGLYPTARARHELLADEIGTRHVRHRPPRAGKPKRTSGWDGVRNFQARNFMREMQQGRPRVLLSLELRRAGHRRHRRGGARGVSRTARRSIRRTITTTPTAIRTSRAGTWST